MVTHRYSFLHPFGSALVPEILDYAKSRLVTAAYPRLAAPVVDAADQHIACIKGDFRLRRNHRRAGIGQDRKFFVRSDDPIRLGKIEPAVPAAATHHGIGSG